MLETASGPIGAYFSFGTYRPLPSNLSTLEEPKAITAPEAKGPANVLTIGAAFVIKVALQC